LSSQLLIEQPATKPTKPNVLDYIPNKFGENQMKIGCDMVENVTQTALKQHILRHLKLQLSGYMRI
jgi:hypothetical protein